MGNVLVYLIGFVLACLAVYYLFFSRKAIVHAKITKTKSRKISEVLDSDEVSIKGKVVYLGRTMLAPLSKRKCVYYHVTVESQPDERRTTSEIIDIDEEKAADVVIYDGEFYAVISTKSVKTYIVKDETFYTGYWNISSDELDAFLVKHGKKPKNYMGWSLTLTAKEGVLEEGELLSVAGKATWRKPSDFKLKIPAQKVLYIEAIDEHGVYLTDDLYVG